MYLPRERSIKLLAMVYRSDVAGRRFRRNLVDDEWREV